MKSVMQKMFQFIPQTSKRRSVFNRSCGHKTTLNGGRIIPYFWDEVLPNDTMNLSATVLIRPTAFVTPIMDNLTVRTEYFFVPLRLIWENYARFFGERVDKDDHIDYVTPKINLSAPVVTHHIGDYLGIPPGVTPNSSFFAFPFRAYCKIYNEYYRDQNIQYRLVENVDDGPDNITDYDWKALIRCKRHDYFTSCLLSPQKGDPVDFPFAESLGVRGTGIALGFDDGTNLGGTWYNAAAGTQVDADQGDIGGIVGAGHTPTGGLLANTVIGVTQTTAQSGLEVDLDNAILPTIEACRYAFALQQFREMEARSGTRYREIVKRFFHCDTGDLRLDRPEYLGGADHYMQISPVNQTSESGTTEQGHQVAVGLYAGNGGGFYKSFNEHGLVMGLITISLDITYQQGISREWWRNDRYDYYWEPFENLGEQAVLNREIWIEGDATDDDVFGYQERYQEYRCKLSMVSGQMRSDFAESLDIWHGAEDFASQPDLNSVFIYDSTETTLERNMATISHGEEDYPQFRLDAYFRYTCERNLCVRGIPGLARL